MTLANLFEEKYSFLGHKSNQNCSYGPNITTITKSFTVGDNIAAGPLMVTSTAATPPKVLPIVATSSSSQPFRQISFNEMQVKKAKRLRFHYDEKFTP